VAQHGALAAGEDRGDPFAFACEVWVADRIDAAVDAMKPALADAAADGHPSHTRRTELLVGDHSVLAGGDLG
jgi:hypothetical protein